MDPLLLRYYNQELQHIREMGGDFAKAYPKIAGRLGLEGFECADPYVERLLEGFAFLTARVQLKIDAEFPRFSQHLLEMVYPHYLAPIPSMAIVQLQPDPDEGSLAKGYTIPRGSAFRSRLGKSEQTACEYRSAHDVNLWPVELVAAKYFTQAGGMSELEVPGARGFKAAIELRLRTTAGLAFQETELDKLVLYLRGSGDVPVQIYERMFANALGVAAMPVQRPAPWSHVVDKSNIRRVGFADGQALLPYGQRSFSGYRLLQEYFAFPQRYLFVEIDGLGPAMRQCNDSELEVMVLLDRSDPFLEKVIDVSHFALHCTPVINLFPKRADRIHITGRLAEEHVVPDRSRPMDFEVYQIDEVMGYGTSGDQAQEFLPFYAAKDNTFDDDEHAYFAVRRTPRVLSERQRRDGARSSYLGSEAFISIVDASATPYRTDMRQLAVSTLCTNRDLPLHMPLGQGKTDFTLEIGAPVDVIRCLDGPTRPQSSHVHGEVAWRLISHLSLNYLTLCDSDEKQGSAGLRELLMLYGDASEATIAKQIEGVRSVSSRPIVRRVAQPGAITAGRGLEVTVTFDESAFEGSGVFLLGAVLEQFFAKYVAINSFTETVMATVERGEIMRWPARAGKRHAL
ncbi:MAG: type VI secretion system baseplate subunit TssF [Gammaproteobacteria bacterium]|nr:type VI secretion system baseplate subunit TssF [Gammaproteobacteria bacterium]MDH3465097.1 type VI secretion system baseplate subunit TssF [Gammaproteobacteria bacterium]